MRCQHGTTLIELMIGAAISLLLVISLMQVFITASNSYSQQLAFNFLEENGLDLSQIFSSAIQSAGYAGCARFTKDFPMHNQTSVLFSPLNVSSDSKFLTITRMSKENNFLLRNMRSKTIIFASKSMKFSDHDILMISDCKSSDIFIAKKIIMKNDTQKIIAELPLSKFYEKNAQIGLLETSIYFVANTGRQNFYKHPIFALYEKNLNQNTVELVEGVNKMSVNIEKINQNPIGVSIQLTLEAIGRFPLEKKWYVYAALR